MSKLFILSVITLVLFVGCGEKKEEAKVAPGMKCGAGKCGANMFDGNSALEKKKKNILLQMQEGDTRKDCVIGAKTTKEVYDCVRDKSGKLSVKDDLENSKEKNTTKAPAMKCGIGKCGSSM